MKKQGEEEYWSRFAESYDHDGEYVVGTRIIRLIREALLGESSLGTALECGCGTGTFTEAIARNARHLVASDLSRQMLEAARVRLQGFENVAVREADCTNIPFADRSFDSVFLTNLLHVLHDPLQCLRESHRILQDSGSLIVVDFTGYRLRIDKKMKLGLRYLGVWGPPPRGGRSNMSARELQSLVEQAGFRVQQVQLLRGRANALYLRGTKQPRRIA